jgi:hypothetical protein
VEAQCCLALTRLILKRPRTFFAAVKKGKKKLNPSAKQARNQREKCSLNMNKKYNINMLSIDKNFPQVRAKKAAHSSVVAVPSFRHSPGASPVFILLDPGGHSKIVAL